jgi:uncharacterized protein involved in exopolysaccharide biosynthesis
MPDTPSSGEPQYEYAEDEISLLDIGVTLARKKKLIVRTMIGFAVIGLVQALSASPEYRTSMTVMSELGSEGVQAGGIGATLRAFGFSLPGGGTGGTLSAQAIPDIVGSRQVRLAVARDTFYFQMLEGEATLVEFLNRSPSVLGAVIGFVNAYTIGLPGKILALFRGSRAAGRDGANSFLTEEEEASLEWLSGAISTSEDIDSGLITITATTDDPLVSAQLVESVAEKLRTRVQEVYTSKARQNLDFVQEQFDAVAHELQAADEALAAFQDRNQGVVSSRLGLDQQRLQRDVTFKSQLYTELQAQLTQTRIELQKAEPVITTIEAPIPPLKPSGPNRNLTVLLALILGGMVGVGLAFVSTALERGGQDPEDREKLAEIRAAMPKVPGFVGRWAERWVRRS